MTIARPTRQKNRPRRPGSSTLLIAAATVVAVVIVTVTRSTSGFTDLAALFVALAAAGRSGRGDRRH